MIMLRTALAGAALLALAQPTLAAGVRGDAAAGKEKSALCAQCHGADGNSKVAQFPRLAGQYPDYLVRALGDYASGARRNPIMGPIAKKLSREDREDLAAYFAAQEGLTTLRRP